MHLIINSFLFKYEIFHIIIKLVLLLPINQLLAHHYRKGATNFITFLYYFFF